MAILEVSNLKKIYTTRFGGNLTNDELYVKIQDALMLITTGGEKHE